MNQALLVSSWGETGKSCVYRLVFGGVLLVKSPHFVGFVTCTMGATVANIARGQGTPGVQGFSKVTGPRQSGRGGGQIQAQLLN